MCNFGRGCYEEQFFEIILNLGLWLGRRCLIKILIYTSGGPIDRWSVTIHAILKEGIIGNIYVKLFEIWNSGLGEDVV